MQKYEFTVKGKHYIVRVVELGAKQLTLEVNGKLISAELSGGTAAKVRDESQGAAKIEKTPASKSIAGRGSSSASPAKPASKPVSGLSSAQSLTAPIPGAIMEIFVKPGQQVSNGEVVLKMEAMKMENSLNSPCDGTVKEVHVEVGAAVRQGELLIEFE